MCLFLKLYFPLLYSVDDVKDKNSFESKARSLIDANKKHVKKYYNTYNNFINLFYDLVFLMETMTFHLQKQELIILNLLFIQLVL